MCRFIGYLSDIQLSTSVSPSDQVEWIRVGTRQGQETTKGRKHEQDRASMEGEHPERGRESREGWGGRDKVESEEDVGWRRRGEREERQNGEEGESRGEKMRGASGVAVQTNSRVRASPPFEPVVPLQESDCEALKASAMDGPHRMYGRARTVVVPSLYSLADALDDPIELAVHLLEALAPVRQAVRVREELLPIRISLG